MNAQVCDLVPGDIYKVVYGSSQGDARLIISIRTYDNINLFVDEIEISSGMLIQRVLFTQQNVIILT